MNRLEKITNVLKKWWLVLIIGIISLILGINILINPGMAPVLVKLIIVIDLISVGITEAIAIITYRKEIPAWGWNLIAALLSVVLGIILACIPGAAGFSMLMCILFALGFVFEGVSVFSGAFALKAAGVKGWGWNLALGIIIILLGFSLIASPVISFISVGLLIGIVMVATAVGLIVLSIRMSKTKAMIDRKMI